MKYLVFVLGLLTLCTTGAQARSWYTARRPAPVTKKPYVAPMIPLTPAEQAAKNVLDKMAGALNGADGVTYDADIVYAAELGGKIVNRHATATTTLERTAKMFIQASDDRSQPDGTIVATGVLFTLFDSTSNQYVQITTSADLYSVEQALEMAGNQIYPKQTSSGRDLRMTIGFPLIFFGRDYDVKEIPNGYTLTYSTSPAFSADSKPVTMVTQTLASTKTGSTAATYMLDPATNLPMEFTQIQTSPGKLPVTVIQETFKNFKLLHHSLPDTTYAYAPPTGATLAPAAQQ